MRLLDGELKRKRGRPKMPGSKCRSVVARLHEDDYQMLKFICEKEGWTTTQAIENMTKIQYNLTRFKE